MNAAIVILAGIGVATIVTALAVLAGWLAARRAAARRARRRESRGYVCLSFIRGEDDMCVMCGDNQREHVADIADYVRKRPITDEDRDELETSMWPK